MDTNATIPPRRSSFAFSDSADTMPGIRHRKSSDRFAAGDLILNRYKVLSELGRAVWVWSINVLMRKPG